MSTDSTTDTNTSTQDGKTTSDTTSGAGDEFSAITSQEDLDRIIRDRVKRERAKFGDYAELKAKAARFDEIEAASKSELEKAIEAREAAEAARDQAVTEVLRYRIAMKHGISDEDADLFLTGTDEATLTSQAERLAERAAAGARNGTRSPREGRAAAADGTSELRDFARELFKPRT